LKYPFLILLLGMHVNIGVLMGLPLFSGAMIVADAAFLPDRFYQALGQLCRRTFLRTGGMGAEAPVGTAPAAVPPQTSPEQGSWPQPQRPLLRGSAAQAAERRPTSSAEVPAANE
ncbi:MAG TPA: hypothetical protein VIU94_17760, partial [Streptomyces sp.]